MYRYSEMEWASLRKKTKNIRQCDYMHVGAGKGWACGPQGRQCKHRGLYKWGKKWYCLIHHESKRIDAESRGPS